MVKKSGLETKLREKAPHLLDIDGDICHHIHNTVKKFGFPFINFLKCLVDDIHINSKYITDVRQAIDNICFILDILYKKPPQHLSHRWLSSYDCTVTLKSMVDAFYLFYFSWLEPDLRYSYKDDIQAIYNKYINEIGVNKIKDINKPFKKKTLTEDGRDRMHRIVEKLIYKHKSLLLISNSYTTILPLFKSMVLVFEQKEPQVHKLHDMMVNNLRSFLACFIKYEVIKNISPKQLKKVNILDNVRQPRSFFVGDSNEILISNMLKDKNDCEIAKEFLESLKSA